jgi:hypothetical protein
MTKKKTPPRKAVNSKAIVKKKVLVAKTKKRSMIPAAAGLALDAFLAANPKTRGLAKILSEMGIDAATLLTKLQGVWRGMKGYEDPATLRGEVEGIKGMSDEERKMQEETAPVAYNSVVREATDFQVGSIDGVSPSKGIRIRGSQVVCDAKDDASYGPFSTTSGPWVAGLSRQLEVNPSDMGSRIMKMASLYSTFKVRKLVMIYAPSVSTADTVQYGIAYSENIHPAASGTGMPSTFGELAEEEHCVIFPTREPTMIPLIDEHTHSPHESYTCAQPVGGDEGEHSLAIQGLIHGLSSSAVVAKKGLFYMIYEIDFFGPTMDQSFTSRFGDHLFYSAVDRELKRQLWVLDQKFDWEATLLLKAEEDVEECPDHFSLSITLVPKELTRLSCYKPSLYQFLQEGDEDLIPVVPPVDSTFTLLNGRAKR